MTRDLATKALKLFFQINDKDLGEDFEFRENTYDDEHFRWSKGDFKHGKKLTVIYNSNRILMFDTIKVAERLTANTDRLQHDKNKENYACKMGIVKDIVHRLNAEVLTDEEIYDFVHRYDYKKELKNNKK